MGSLGETRPRIRSNVYEPFAPVFFSRLIYPAISARQATTAVPFLSAVIACTSTQDPGSIQRPGEAQASLQACGACRCFEGFQQ